MIAVTGANGLLGNFVLRSLASQAPVIALHRANSDLSSVKDIPNVIWREADVTNPASLQDALQDATTVIHTAAVVSFNPRLRKKMLAVNTIGTRNVVDACLCLQIPRLIHVSSVAALGRKQGVFRVDENTRWADSDMNTDYAESKHLAELEVWRGAEEGLSVNIINPSVILAPANWQKSSARLFEYVWQQRKFYTDTHINYTDVRDVVDVISKLLNSSVSNQQYIVNAGSIPVKTLFELIAGHFNRKAPAVRITPAFAKWIAWAEEIRCWFTGNEPLITRQSTRITQQNFFFAN